jgi:3',5'-cyclic AMP phosphodiesterase CpdA
MRRLVLIALLLVSLPSVTAGQELRLPNKEGSVKFAIIGDSGEPGTGQRQVAAQMAAWRQRFPFEFILMTGDNLYGRETPGDYESKFARPYKALIDGGAKFYAALGNHDDDGQTQYKLFNMGGRKYYSFKPKDGVRFFAIDSNYVDAKQLEWLDKELEASGSDWKIAFFHHPLYSSARTHGSQLKLRAVLEPLFIQYNVSLVLNGHDHAYERIKPQNGIQYFLEGSSGKLRRGDLRQGSPLTAFGNDQTRTFMLMEIDGDTMTFNTIDMAGTVIDSGMVTRRK